MILVNRTNNNNCDYSDYTIINSNILKFNSSSSRNKV